MKGSVRYIIGRVAAIIALVVALLLLVSSYSYLISPFRSVIFSFLGLAYPIFFVLNILLLLLFLFIKKKLALIPIAAMLLSWGSITSYFPLNVSSKEAVSCDSLVILTYNTQHFAMYRSHTEDNPNPVLRYVADSGADIICMQEFGHFHKEPFLTVYDVRSELNAKYPYHNVVSKNGLEMACYSKYPIKKSYKIDFGERTLNNACYYDIDVNGRTITVFNNHLESNKIDDTDKVVYKDVIKHGSTERLDELGNRLLPKLAEAFRIRARQSWLVAEQIAKNPHPVIVCGDFNDTPQSYAYNQVRGDLGDAVVDAGFGPTITYHASGFLFRIDHILYDEDVFTVVDVERGDLKGSDHYPLKATFVW